VLGIRALEVLKASALKRLIDAPPPPPSALPPPATPPVTSPAAPPPRVGLDAGLAVLGNVGGPGPALLPVVRGRLRLGTVFFARLTLAGGGSEARVDTKDGSATVAQSFALAELATALRPGRRLRPGLSVGVGALRDESRGEGRWPYLGRDDAQWAFALDGGLGVLLQVSRSVAFALEAHALVALPHATVRFDTSEAARLGFPALLGSLTLVAWL